MSSLRVGVDAGGTHAEAVVVDDRGREVGRARAHGAVLTADAPERAVAAVAAAVRAALAASEASGEPDALWAGLAGAGREALRAQAERALADLGVATRVRVGTDVDVAFASAFGEGPGILLIAGTGSVAVARDRHGRRFQVGGWGARLGDEGSGYWIGMQALGCVARAEDGRAQRTRLRDRLLQHLGLTDPRALIDWIERASKADVAALTPVVVETARAGDPVAASIATDAAAALRTHLVAVLDRLESDAGTDAASSFGLALWGGLIAPGGALRSVLEPLIEPLGLPLVQHVMDPALGAAELARRLA